MKTYFINILKTFVFLTLVTTSAVFADAASFDTDPSGRTGITSIIEGECSTCGGQKTSVDLSSELNNPGDSTYVTVFTDFMALRNSSETVYGARGVYHTQNKSGLSSSSYTFKTSLSANNASGISDDVRVSGLPDSYKIEVVSGHVENSHGGRRGCDPAYNYNRYIDAQSSSLFGRGKDLGDLTNENNGWCAQGTIAIKYRITNTESNVPDPVNVDVQTNTASNLQTNSATLNGVVNQGDNLNVWFRYSTSSNVSCSNGNYISVSGSYDSGDRFSQTVSGLSSDTRYYYVACTDNDAGSVRDFRTNDDVVNETLSVETRSETNVAQTSANMGSATLNGAILSGTSQRAYFVVSADSTPSCYTSTQTPAYRFDRPYSAGDSFYYAGSNTYALDTTYYYRACASANGIISQGGVESFRINKEGSTNPTNLSVETRQEKNVNRTSATLRGRVETGTYEDVTVFFVWGEDLSDIENVTDENRYSDISVDGRNIQKQKVRQNFDGERNFELDVSGLRAGERIYFRQCVEYQKTNGADDIACGNLENFETEDSVNNTNNDIEIQTDPARNITRTSAQMCGRLIEDGGSSVQTWIKFRRSDQSGFDKTPTRQRGEVAFCEDVSNLQPNTTYRFRACTPEGCGIERSFRTGDITNVNSGKPPVILTDSPTAIRSNSATLNSRYAANGAPATCRFDYGRTQALGKRTRSYNVNGVGECPHNFTNLAAGTQYCVQAVIETRYGTDRGKIWCFNTPQAAVRNTTTRTVVRTVTPPPVVVVEDDNEDLDLGLGLSLIRLEIDDEKEVVTEGSSVEYVVEWQNISELDLTDLELEVSIPSEIKITDVSRGRLDQDSNKIYYTIDELEGADYENNTPGERGQMTVTGIVGRGTIGNLLTADAEVVYENPVNRAREDARDFDLDEYGARIAGVTASVFGLSNITFLGWLVILLGLFIIFLVARWLYLEREELRAQAYLTGGYGSHGYGTPRMPVYRDPAPRYDVPPAAPRYDVPAAPQNVAPAPADDYYEPYRPNRG